MNARAAEGSVIFEVGLKKEVETPHENMNWSELLNP